MVHGIGIDTVHISRFRAAMERFGPRLLERLFTASELEYCLGQRMPERHLSARFAAKVSFMKALGRPMGFKDVEVLRNQGGAPAIRAKGMDEALRVSLSIAHDGDLSIAETVIEKDR